MHVDAEGYQAENKDGGRPVQTLGDQTIALLTVGKHTVTDYCRSFISVMTVMVIGPVGKLLPTLKAT